MSNQVLRRMTRQRKIILEELQKTKKHPTADDLYQVVKVKLPRISLGTVYRNLEILSSDGLIKKLEMAGSQKRFDGDLSDHHHVRCTSCGRVDDLPFKERGLELLRNKLEEVSDYRITGHAIEFFGVCPECQGREDDHG